MYVVNSEARGLQQARGKLVDVCEMASEVGPRLRSRRRDPDLAGFVLEFCGPAEGPIAQS